MLTLLHHLATEADGLPPEVKCELGLAAAKGAILLVVRLRPGTGRHRRPIRARK